MPTSDDIRALYVTTINEMASKLANKPSALTMVDAKKAVTNGCLDTYDVSTAVENIVENITVHIDTSNSGAVVAILTQLEDAFAFFTAERNRIVREHARTLRNGSSGLSADDVAELDKLKKTARTLAETLKLLDVSDLPPVPSYRAPWGSKKKDDTPTTRKNARKETVYSVDGHIVSGMSVTAAMFGYTKGFGGSGLNGRITLDDLRAGGADNPRTSEWRANVNGHNIRAMVVAQEEDEENDE